MSIQVHCANCQKTMKVNDKAAGTRGHCPFCNSVIDVPGSAIPDSIASVGRSAKPKVTSPPPQPRRTAPIVNTASVSPQSYLQLMSHQGETTIFSTYNVKVTTARVVCDGTTYSLRNITSVQMQQTNPGRLGPLLSFSIGVVFAILGLGELSANRARSGEGVMPFLIGAGLIVGGIVSLKSKKTKCHVLIASSSGEAEAYTSKDRQEVSNIVAAVNEAIVRYR